MSKLPRPLLTLLEARAGFEMGEMLLSLPMLGRAPLGDGHPVLLLPGFGADDRSTFALRGYLSAMGYAPTGWGLGRNDGNVPQLLSRVTARVAELSADVQAGAGV